MKANEYIGKFMTTIDNLDKSGKHVPGLIMSHAGYGKTSTIEMWCEYMDYGLVTLVPSTCASDDILGLQSIKDGELVKLTPYWYNNLMRISDNGNKRTVLFIDELSSTDPYVQAPLLDLIFNRNLGDKKLPDNCLIVAAGNYSEDLGGEFKMSSPLVNRFVILNLTNEDLDMKDIISNSFEEVSTKEEIRKYLGLDDSEDAKEYNIDKFKEWIVESNEVQFGNAFHEENEFGLMGFTSPRSMSRCCSYAESYMKLFHDNGWMRIVGDTLGMSNKREGKPMRLILEANHTKFIGGTNKKIEKKTIIELCTYMMDNGLNDSYLGELEKLVYETSLDDIPDKEFNVLTKFIKKFCESEKVQYINRCLLTKY